MDEMTHFTVPGNPAPQGSKRHIGNGRMIESSRAVGPRRERIALVAHNAMLGHPLLQAAVAVNLHFVMPRPKSAPKTTPEAVKRPDIDKLVRACLDAFTGTCFVDDSQVTELHATKRIAEPGEPTGVHVQIEAT